jgi:hypothetical protein
MYDNATKDKFIELRARNVPYARIASELGITPMTAIRWAEKHRAAIEALASVQAELLREQLYASREKEIEALARRLQRLEYELDQRNPQYMHTRELTDLIRLTRARLDAFCKEPRLPEEMSAEVQTDQPHAAAA